MQKFGLQRSAKQFYNAVELEIIKEQASALGRAGKKLRISLEEYQKLVEQAHHASDLEVSLNEISNNVWELMLQREIVGFSEANLEWLRDNYHIPDAAISRLGRR